MVTSTVQLHLLDQSDKEKLSKEMEYQQQQQRPGGLASDYYNGGQQQPYPQQPPDYRQQQYAPPASDSKQSFEQAFKVVKPKWNDLWAGILVRRISYCMQTGDNFFKLLPAYIVDAQLNYTIVCAAGKLPQPTPGFATGYYD
ncbi:MAG: putative choline transporter, neither null mutation nor overexpression affects choline transport [Geoglossum umbratile]|nr:MAG: putative choline transporter, neither null mutation nor overexpression affects choline transport [Geoglossum umbratile]